MCTRRGRPSSWAAGAAAVYTVAHDLMRKNQIDDDDDAAPVHGFVGGWGCICVGLCHPEMGFLTNMLKGEFTPQLLQTQIIGVASLSALGFFPIYVVCQVLHSFNCLRTSPVEEEMGLDQYVFQLHAYTVRTPAQASNQRARGRMDHFATPLYPSFLSLHPPFPFPPPAPSPSPPPPPCVASPACCLLNVPSLPPRLTC